MGFYNAATDKWEYLPGYATQGTAAIMTCIGSSFYVVGGEDYTGADKSYASDDAVHWKYTGATISNDALL